MTAIKTDIKIGHQYRFDYPKEFTTLPKYTAHRGEIVTVLRPLRDGDEYNYEGDAMFEVRAEDGWIGHAWESELVEDRT